MVNVAVFAARHRFEIFGIIDDLILVIILPGYLTVALFGLLWPTDKQVGLLRRHCALRSRRHLALDERTALEAI